MNTVLVISFDGSDVVIAKERVLDDQVTYWALAAAWLAEEGTAKVKVEFYDAHDVCAKCYEVTQVM